MLRPHKPISIVSIAALLAGCASYQAEPISSSANAAAFDARTLNDPRLEQFVQASLPTQPDAAGSPTWDLGTLTLAAVYFHPDLDVARAKLAVSQAGVTTARQRPNPTLNFTGIFGTAAVAGTIPPAVAPITIGPVINFIVETFGKRGARTAQAQYLTESARWDLATAGWQVRSRVRTALLNLWAGQLRLALAQRRLTLQHQLVALLESRFSSGEASSLDVTRERINRAQVELSIRDTERSVADARAQLATAIGVPLRALDGVTVALDAFGNPQIPSGDLASGELRQRALTSRTDAQATLAEYEAAQSALQLQVANQYPNLTLGSGYNYDFGVNKFILSPAIDLPIFNHNEGQIAQALANRQQAAATFTALQGQIIGAIDLASVAYRTATQSLATADALLVDEQRRQRQVASSFRAGEVDRPTFVTTELELAVIQALRLDALIVQRQALGGLEDALQQPIFDPGETLSVPQSNPRLTTERS